MDWIGLDWIGLDWIGLGWVGFGWVGLGWNYLHCLGIWMEKSIDVVSEPVVNAPLTGISFFSFFPGDSGI